LGFKLDKATHAALKTDEARRDALEELKQNEIDNGIVKLESLLNATVDKDFDKFEIYTLRNILAVGHEEEDLADWVRLDHYKGVDVSTTGPAPSPEEIEAQRSRLHETAKFNVMLKAEEAKNAAILSQLTALLSAEPGHSEASTAAPLAFLNAPASTNGEQSLTQATQYALNQLPALRQLLAQLSTTMQTLPREWAARHDDEDNAEARRRRYLESQTWRALKGRGIEAESSGSASLTTGRKLAQTELEGIEAVARGVGSTTTQNKDHDTAMED
jgi:kinetochore protein Mis12/MTW1